MNRKRQPGFTLIELLVVIGIMALVMAVALPGFQGIGRGSGMNSAISDVASTLALARQWAITHRQDTYVVFPTGALNFPQDLDKANRAYGVFAVTNKAATLTGNYVSEWKYLPAGVVFNTNANLSQSVFKSSQLSSIPYPTEIDSAVSVNAIRFKPDGSTTLSSGVEVYLVEGWALISTSGASRVLDFGIRLNGVTNGVEVSGLTGGLKVNRH